MSKEYEAMIKQLIVDRDKEQKARIAELEKELSECRVELEKIDEAAIKCDAENAGLKAELRLTKERVQRSSWNKGAVSPSEHDFYVVQLKLKKRPSGVPFGPELKKPFYHIGEYTKDGWLFRGYLEEEVTIVRWVSMDGA